MEHNDSLTSFVQIRGSLPFFWKQTPTLEYHVKPVIYNHMDHEKPFNSHLEKLVHNYGAQILVNLINKQKTEGELQQKYRLDNFQDFFARLAHLTGAPRLARPPRPGLA